MHKNFKLTTYKTAKPKTATLRRLELAMYLWAGTVCTFLGLLLIEPQLLYPDSPGLERNSIIDYFGRGQALPKPRIAQTLPGIDNYQGDPTFNDNVSKFDAQLAMAADKYSLDCTLLKAQMMTESRGIPGQASAAGAIGLMQLLPSTARAMGFSGSLRDPLTSIMAGAKYLKHLESTGCYEQPRNAVCDTAVDIKFQIAAYNGGSRCNKPAYVSACNGLTIWECGWFDAYSETRAYVNRVKANYHYLRVNGWGC